MLFLQPWPYLLLASVSAFRTRRRDAAWAGKTLQIQSNASNHSTGESCLCSDEEIEKWITDWEKKKEHIAAKQEYRRKVGRSLKAVVSQLLDSQLDHWIQKTDELYASNPKVLVLAYVSDALSGIGVQAGLFGAKTLAGLVGQSVAATAMSFAATQILLLPLATLALWVRGSVNSARREASKYGPFEPPQLVCGQAVGAVAKELYDNILNACKAIWPQDSTLRVHQFAAAAYANCRWEPRAAWNGGILPTQRGWKHRDDKWRTLGETWFKALDEAMNARKKVDEIFKECGKDVQCRREKCGTNKPIISGSSCAAEWARVDLCASEDCVAGKRDEVFVSYARDYRLGDPKSLDTEHRSHTAMNRWAFTRTHVCSKHPSVEDLERITSRFVHFTLCSFNSWVKRQVGSQKQLNADDLLTTLQDLDAVPLFLEKLRSEGVMVSGRSAWTLLKEAFE